MSYLSGSRHVYFSFFCLMDNNTTQRDRSACERIILAFINDNIPEIGEYDEEIKDKSLSDYNLQDLWTRLQVKDIPDAKTCSTCWNIKDRSEFFIDSYYWKIRSSCKECERQKALDRHNENKRIDKAAVDMTLLNNTPTTCTRIKTTRNYASF